MHQVYGIRHHGPGSARSLIAAFEASPPDALVIEAPEELVALFPWLDHADLQPPVAALIWATEDSRQASFYPFAVFSPEWVALRWARSRNLPIYCMDLPMRHSLALRAAPKREDSPDQPGSDRPAASELSPSEDAAIDNTDPITALAQAAGYEDGEAWWEHLVEAQGHDAFPAIIEAMAAARDAGLGRLDEETLRREACMRQTLRAALKNCHSRVAVVCGAYHAPVLTTEGLKAHPIKDDSARLKGLPKLKVECTWVPWSSSKLAFASGYGAGVEAPGWYAHLWQSETATDIATGWLAKIAQALRKEDIDAPAASVIEAVRLAQTLATLRQRRSPDLSELREASLAALCHGETLTLRLAEERLLGRSPRFDVLGRVPESLPQSPLQADFAAQNRSLRLKTEALERQLELDLRQDQDRAKSQYFWRLRLLALDWAQPLEANRGKGTFRETWRLRWMPEAILALIDAGRHGGTIAEAAQAKARERLQASTGLSYLLVLADEVLKAALGNELPAVLEALDARAAVASDITELMAALPPLISLVRYGDVRGTSLSGVQTLLHGVLMRTCVALPNGCAQLSAEAAADLATALEASHSGLQTLADASLLQEWLAALSTLANASTTPALIAGRSVRLLLDAARLDSTEAERRLALALSAAAAPAEAAGWLEGFLRGSVHVLLGNHELRNLIGTWLSALNAADFQSTLPLVRRAFSSFAAPERRLLLQEILRGTGPEDNAMLEEDYDPVAYRLVREGLRGWLGS